MRRQPVGVAQVLVLVVGHGEDFGRRKLGGSGHRQESEGNQLKLKELCLESTVRLIKEIQEESLTNFMAVGCSFGVFDWKKEKGVA